MKFLFSPDAIAPEKVYALLRMFVGALLVYHGHEIFRREIMESYLTWDMFKGPNGELKVYVGKTSEFIAGLSLLFGFLTRLGSLLLIGTLSFITFVMGHGRFWYEDQHPFMFVLFGILFFFFGAGIWSVDQALFKPKK